MFWYSDSYNLILSLPCRRRFAFSINSPATCCQRFVCASHRAVKTIRQLATFPRTQLFHLQFKLRARARSTRTNKSDRRSPDPQFYSRSGSDEAGAKSGNSLRAAESAIARFGEFSVREGSELFSGQGLTHLGKGKEIDHRAFGKTKLARNILQAVRWAEAFHNSGLWAACVLDEGTNFRFFLRSLSCTSTSNRFWDTGAVQSILFVLFSSFVILLDNNLCKFGWTTFDESRNWRNQRLSKRDNKYDERV